MYLQLHVCLPIYTPHETKIASEKIVKGKVTFQPSIFAILVSDTLEPQEPKRQGFRPSIYGLWRSDPPKKMKETWVPMVSFRKGGHWIAPQGLLLRWLRGAGGWEKHGQNSRSKKLPFWWTIPVLGHLFECVSLQGTDTYPHQTGSSEKHRVFKSAFWQDMLVPRRVNPYYTQLGGDFIFTNTWGNDPIRRAYFSDGLNPPTSQTWPLSWVFIDIEWGFSWTLFAGNLSFT